MLKPHSALATMPVVPDEVKNPAEWWAETRQRWRRGGGEKRGPLLDFARDRANFCCVRLPPTPWAMEQKKKQKEQRSGVPAKKQKEKEKQKKKQKEQRKKQKEQKKKQKTEHKEEKKEEEQQKKKQKTEQKVGEVWYEGDPMFWPEWH